MSEEAAFLAALKANPADDTTRLVYADWLDEHGESAKAEYLRAVIEFARGSLPVVDSLLTLAGTLPSDWRLATAARFVLVLESFEPNMKIQAIKAVREMTGMGLGEAKQFVERAPSRFPFRTTVEGAKGLIQHFNPGRVEINPYAGGDHERTVAGVQYLIEASIQPRYDWDDYHDRLPEARTAFLDFLSRARAISREAAAAMAGESFLVTLGVEFLPILAQRELDRYRSFLSPDDLARHWQIVLDVRSVLPEAQ